MAREVLKNVTVPTADGQGTRLLTAGKPVPADVPAGTVASMERLGQCTADEKTEAKKANTKRTQSAE